MENNEKRLSVDVLMEEKQRVLTLIANKREGRKAMEENGMEIEPESEDMDMQDLFAQIEAIDIQLGNNPDEPRFPEMP